MQPLLYRTSLTDKKKTAETASACMLSLLFCHSMFRPEQAEPGRPVPGLFSLEEERSYLLELLVCYSAGLYEGLCAILQGCIVWAVVSDFAFEVLK